MAYSTLIGKGSKEQIYLRCAMANRHGLIAGATGTGKTVSLKVLAEGFSRMGVPVFMADVKGDLAGLAFPGEDNPKIKERCALVGVENFTCAANPVVFWDVMGEQGHPVRATVSEMGPLLFSRLLGLNETQAAVLSLVFKVADDEKLLLLDLKDLQAMVTEVGNHAKELATTYGNIATATIGAIQRGLVTLGEKGGDKFFGEPSLNIDDLIQTVGGKGVINILAADKLMQNPTIYSTFLLWLLADLFEHLPEVGDMEKPKLVFFFDEAHLLFSEAPKALLEKIEQVVRLIRSKGVGVYFVTQSPLDVPDTVLGQLGNRIQHALRAFTPRDQKAVRSAAETFRSDGSVDVAEVIMNLNVGEALVSVLDEKGAPTVVERAWIAPPQSRFGAITPDERKGAIQKSLVFGHYEKTIDRESAYEILKKKAETTPDPKAAAAAAKKPSLFKTFLTSAVRSMGVALSGILVRGILNNLIKGGKKK